MKKAVGILLEKKSYNPWIVLMNLASVVEDNKT
jgi:hypothetical protein